MVNTPEGREVISRSEHYSDAISGKYMEIPDFIRAETFKFRKAGADPTKNYCWCMKGGGYFSGCTGTFDKNDILVRAYFQVKGGSRIETWKFNCFVIAFNLSVDEWRAQLIITLENEKGNIELIDSKVYDTPAYAPLGIEITDNIRRKAIAKFNTYKGRFLVDVDSHNIVQYNRYNELLKIYWKLYNTSDAPYDWVLFLEEYKWINSDENKKALGITTHD